MERPSVTLFSSSGANQAQLDEALLRAGLLRMVVRTAPELEVLAPGPSGELELLRRFPSYRLGSRILWGVRRRLPGPWQKFTPQLEWSWLADRWISKWIRPCGVFHGLLGMCLASLNQAQRLGAVTLIDHGILHPAAFEREALEDYSRAGVKPNGAERAMPPRLLRRCERQYQACDRIIAYSSAAARSFDGFSYSRKVVVVNPGIDHVRWSPGAGKADGRVFRVCYIGRIEAPKGIQYLVDAWKRLALPNAELTLIGRVLPELRYLQSEGPAIGVRLAGIVSREEVVSLRQESNLFVLPSVNEGLSLSLLEAMSCGLPVIACEATGAEDCVTSGREGLLIPGRSPDALADTLQWCYRHRDELAVMGQAARLRVEQEFTLAHYAQRLIALYQEVSR